ncbi:MAG: SLATT domain-containing protein [Magnetococcus sp. MYC-9]
MNQTKDPEPEKKTSSSSDKGDKEKNLALHHFPDFSCQSPEECLQYSKACYDSAVQHNDQAHQWYAKRKKWPSRFSKTIKFSSICLGILGGLAPLLVGGDLFSVSDPSAWPLWLRIVRQPGDLGYVLLALGGGLVLFDKMFGFSSNWMRYIEAMRCLEDVAARFEQQWTAKAMRVHCQRNATPPSPPDPKAIMTASIELLHVAAEYRRATLACLDKETREWLAEFKANHAQMQSQKPPLSTGGVETPQGDGHGGGKAGGTSPTGVKTGASQAAAGKT